MLRTQPPILTTPARFDDLGLPFAVDPLEIHVTTRDAPGRVLAFGRVHDKGGSHYDVFVVDLETGSAEWLGLPEAFGATYIQMTRAASGHVYLLSGEPTHFSKYDVDARRLVDLGTPGGASVSYMFDHHVGPDGVIYAAGYPDARTVVCDPRDDSVRDLGCMTEDPAQQKYANPPAVGGANAWLYTPLGLHHMELCAYHMETGERRQILPPEVASQPGAPTVFTGADGNVYGQAGERTFLCTPKGIRDVDTLPEAAAPQVSQRIDGLEVREIGVDGRLVITELGASSLRTIETPFSAITYGVYSIGCERGSTIYGGGANGRANVFAYSQKTGEVRDCGRQGGGRVQVYDLLNHPRGLYLTSYPGGCIDLFVPETGERIAVASLAAEHHQERLQRLTLGPDGMIYSGGVPIKGRLGGAVVRLDPIDHSMKVWRDVVPNQSFNVGVSVPATGEMFFTTTIRGGTSAIPTETEACVILWSCEGEAVVWQGRPLPGTANYSYATRARNGLIYGLGEGNAYYAFDPVSRTVAHRGTLPVSSVHTLGLAREAVGPQGLIYGLGDDGVFAIDPADHLARVFARHESIARAHGLYAADDGTLYYGSGPRLWRVSLNQ